MRRPPDQGDEPGDRRLAAEVDGPRAGRGDGPAPGQVAGRPRDRRPKPDGEQVPADLREARDVPVLRLPDGPGHQHGERPFPEPARPQQVLDRAGLSPAAGGWRDRAAGRRGRAGRRARDSGPPRGRREWGSGCGGCRRARTPRGRRSTRGGRGSRGDRPASPPPVPPPGRSNPIRTGAPLARVNTADRNWPCMSMTRSYRARRIAETVGTGPSGRRPAPAEPGIVLPGEQDRVRQGGMMADQVGVLGRDQPVDPRLGIACPQLDQDRQRMDDIPHAPTA